MDPPDPPARPQERRHRHVLALWLALFAIYNANGREIGTADTTPALFQSITVLRGDGFRLDRFRNQWPDTLPYSVTRKRGALVSRYPVGPPILALPFALPQLLVLDTFEPSWEADPTRTLLWVRRVGKVSAAAIGASTGACLYAALRAAVPGSAALAATLIAALGSNLWMTGSQSLWTQGSAALGISATLALLLVPAPQRWRFALAGGACAVTVISRPADIIFAALVLLWVLRHHPARTIWFAALPSAAALLLLGYNWFYFGGATGGYGELVQMVGRGSHGVAGFWGESIGASLLGTLLSPSRGLFIFSPWIALSLVLLPTYAPALRRQPLIATVLWTLPILLVQFALQSTWWAGWSFGPRYWTDVLPLFAVLLAHAIAAARRRGRLAHAALIATGAFAVAVQALGAFCYPSSFNALPADIDHQHERLWSWRDGELARCLREGAHGWE